jgi:anti-sigma B factor antagonist
MSRLDACRSRTYVSGPFADGVTVAKGQERPLVVRADEEGVLWVSGELDMAQAIRFTGAVLDILDKAGRNDLILDLSEVTFLDSTGLRAIFQLSGRCEGRVVLRNPRGNVAQLLAIAGADGPLEVRIERTPG